MTSTPPADAPDLYAVLGNPVEHSQSPFIHGEFARQTGERIDYVRVCCPLDGFAPALRRFAAEGDGVHRGRPRGCNVTVPFKFEVPRLAARLSERATLAQAANTLRFDTDGWYADNTDGVGLRRDVEHNAGMPLAGRRVLLIGAGGAAAGVLGPLLAAAPAVVTVANRTPDKAHALVQRHAGWARRHGATLNAAPLDAPGAGFDLVVNASASSLAGQAVPVPATVLRVGTLAVDLMYGPAATGFTGWAQANGAIGRDGLGMLVEQAAEAFALWRGVRPDTAPVLDALRARLSDRS
ncbi:MAG: shikimate dehydrogenase [Gammaproteobacteria bacterium]|uniref:shikimate dehydrogenase n=1 Tax=Azohydromonas sp. TaxID=1872666 RepID=UPI002D0B7235|nr:shikimate dehydrogenase [Azohydromonas sp.]HMM87136.1 shikimate dehydrogenase [Azohydromonas sp.]